MRVFLAAVLVAIPAIAAGQSRGPSSAAVSHLPPMLGPIGLPLPPIGLGLPPIGLPPVVETQTHAVRPQSGDGVGRRGRRSGFKHAPTIVYFLPTTDWWPYWELPPAYPQTTTFEPRVPPVADPPMRPGGTLRMEVQPAGPHPTYIDGAYIGTLDDFNSELILEPGRHSVEVRGPGFEPLAFDVSIQAGRSITYRGVLKPAAPEPAGAAGPDVKPAAPIPPSVFYFIPGCYLGNVAPATVKLPDGCDSSRLITYKP